jgi:tetratricopeptide (TPR) repeat protein
MNINPIRNRFSNALWGALSALSLFLLASVRLSAELPPTETNVPPQRLSALAETYEQSGDLLEAAAVYERLIDENPTKRMVLAQRLVRIYAKEGQAEKALSWAHVVMEQNPEPQAYLAGVHTLLGHLDEAKDILEKLVAERKEPRQKLTLSWQLAEVYEKQDNIPAAEKTLLESVESVEGTIHETAAWSRICRFYEGHGLLETRMKEWKKAVRKDPENETASWALVAASYGPVGKSFWTA